MHKVMTKFHQKKNILLVILIVVSITILYFIYNGHSTNNSQKTKAIQSCNILTITTARFLLGSNVEKGKVAENKTAESSPDVTTTKCFYRQFGANKDNDLLIVYLLTRDPQTNKSESGIAEDYKQKIKKLEKISAYGGAIYYSYDTGEFEILKHGNWYSLAFGPTIPNHRNLSQNEELVDSIYKKL